MNQYYIKAVVSNGDADSPEVSGHIVSADSVNHAIQIFRELVLVTGDKTSHYELVRDHVFVDIIEIFKVEVSEAV